MAKIATSSKKDTGLNTAFKKLNPIASAASTTPANKGGFDAEVSQLAYQFFVERGYEHGHDREDWARAEAIVKKRRA